MPWGLYEQVGSELQYEYEMKNQVKHPKLKGLDQKMHRMQPPLVGSTYLHIHPARITRQGPIPMALSRDYDSLGDMQGNSDTGEKQMGWMACTKWGQRATGHMVRDPSGNCSRI
jgi:hypothetical protein